MRLVLLAIACVLGATTDVAAQQVRLDNLPAHVIVDSCSGCGGAAGPIAIDQTTPGTTNGVVVNNVPHIVCDSGCGSPPATADNSAFTFGTTAVSPIAAVVDDVAPNTVSENFFGAPRMSPSRLLYLDLSKTGANATPIVVDGSAVTQPVTLAGSTISLPVILSAAVTAAIYDDSTFNRASILTADPGAADPGIVVRTIPSGTQAVSGTFWPTAAASPSATRLSDGAAFIDPRSIRALTSADVVDVSDRSGRALGSIANTTFGQTNWLGSTAPTVGQKTMANSVPIVIASDQPAVPTSVAALPLPSNAAQETGGNLAGTKTNTDKLDIALSALRDAIMTTSTGGTVAARVGGTDPSGTQQTLRTDSSGVLVMQTVRALPWPFRCNALRNTNCQ